MSKLEEVEHTLRRKQVVQELERRQRSMYEAEKEMKRREAAKRAEIEQAAKSAYYERKLAEKEGGIMQRRLQQVQVCNTVCVIAKPSVGSPQKMLTFMITMDMSRIKVQV